MLNNIKNIDIYLLSSLLACVFSIVFFLKSLFSLSSEFANYSAHKKRLKQLRFSDKRELNAQDLIEGITDVIDEHIFSKQKPNDLKKIEKKLAMSGWDEYFEPIQYKAVSTALKIGGLFIFTAFTVASKFSTSGFLVGSLMGLIIGFSIEILLKNEISNRKSKILNHFPELISIIKGYLEAGIPLVEAIAYATPFSGEGWEPLLKKMVIDAELNNIEYALDELKRKVDLLEVKEFASLVKLAYIQGSNVAESFEAQAKRMESIKHEVNQMKIQSRRSMGVLVQMPMLLMVFFAFGLPLYPQLKEMLSSLM